MRVSEDDGERDAGVEYLKRDRPKGQEMRTSRVDLARPRTSRAYGFNLPLGMEVTPPSSMARQIGGQ
jgi:hypothetical protein